MCRRSPPRRSLVVARAAKVDGQARPAGGAPLPQPPGPSSRRHAVAPSLTLSSRNPDLASPNTPMALLTMMASLFAASVEVYQRVQAAAPRRSLVVAREV